MQPGQPEGAPTAGRVQFGEFTLDIGSGALLRGDSLVHLQEKPLQVLSLLVERAGSLVTRDDLRQRLWAADTFVDFDRNVNTAVKKVRIALGDSPDSPRFVETIPKHGYRFIAPVSPAAAISADPPTVDVASPLLPPDEVGATVPVVLAATGRTWGWVRAAALGLAALLLGILATSPGDARLSAAAVKPMRQCPEPVKVAVLPFQHDGRGAPHNLSAELNEGIPRKLLHSSELYVTVLSGRSVQQYACSKKNFQDIGRELGVRYVVEGNVRRAGKGLRVTAQLFETQHGSLVASEYVDVPAEEVSIAQDQVADLVAKAVLRCVAPAQRAALREAELPRMEY